MFVDYIVETGKYEKRLERPKWSTKGSSLKEETEAEKIRNKIVRRAAKELVNGMQVNLGIGIPTLLPSVLPPDVKITLEGEDGVLGIGDYPKKGEK